MNKSLNYIGAVAISVLLCVALYAAKIPFQFIFLINFSYWLWIADLIEMRGRS